MIKKSLPLNPCIKDQAQAPGSGASSKGSKAQSSAKNNWLEKRQSDRKPQKKKKKILSQQKSYLRAARRPVSRLVNRLCKWAYFGNGTRLGRAFWKATERMPKRG